MTDEMQAADAALKRSREVLARSQRVQAWVPLVLLLLILVLLF
jgi:hypothetical protein